IGPISTAAGKTLTLESLGSNKYHLVIVGQNSNYIYPSGTLAYITVHIGTEAPLGLLPVSITGAGFTDLLGDDVPGTSTDGSITVLPQPPVITSSATATGMVGTAFSYQITATNNPTSFNATGVPAGLAVDDGAGLVSMHAPTVG